MEKSILEKLSDSISFPTLFYYSVKYLILVESCHGPNLKKLFQFCGNKFPLRKICTIGIEIISRLQEFHSKSFIHRDKKPSTVNPEINRSQKKNFILLYTIDGLISEFKVF